MIERFMPDSLIKWIKLKFRNQVAEYNRKVNESKQIDPFRIKPGYYPYKEQSKTYVFLKGDTSKEKCENGLPIPPKDLWLGYGNNSDEYIYSGKEQINRMSEILLEAGYDIKNAGRILEMGCGAGRMIRWLYPLTPKCEVIGIDISAEHIFWANRNLNPPFSFATTTIVPHIPFEDGYFDLIFAGSVFTHIDDQVETWLYELSRCLAPAGKLYVTIHDMKTIDHLQNTPVFKESFLAKILSEDENFKKHDRNFEMLVIGRGPDSQVFYDPEYFFKIASPVFTNLGIWEDAYGYQSAVLLQKK